MRYRYAQRLRFAYNGRKAFGGACVQKSIGGADPCERIRPADFSYKSSIDAKRCRKVFESLSFRPVADDDQDWGAFIFRALSIRESDRTVHPFRGNEPRHADEQSTSPNRCPLSYDFFPYLRKGNWAGPDDALFVERFLEFNREDAPKLIAQRI